MDRSLAGYSPGGHKEWDMTEQLSMHTGRRDDTVYGGKTVEEIAKFFNQFLKIILGKNDHYKWQIYMPYTSDIFGFSFKEKDSQTKRIRIINNSVAVWY